jgi:hypothetical protein
MRAVDSGPMLQHEGGESDGYKRDTDFVQPGTSLP